MGTYEVAEVRRRDRALFAEYIEGVADHVNGLTADTGMPVGKDARAHQRAARQGWFDARDGRVLRAYEFTREEVLRRAEVRMLEGSW